MGSDRQPDNSIGRVLRFERGGRRPWRSAAGRQPPTTSPPSWHDRSPVNDVAEYEQHHGEPDDYRHRQIANVAAMLLCTVLAAIGIWLAVKIAELRRDQDCVLAGRRNCAASIVNDALR